MIFFRPCFATKKKSLSVALYFCVLCFLVTKKKKKKKREFERVFETTRGAFSARTTTTQEEREREKKSRVKTENFVTSPFKYKEQYYPRKNSSCC